jgi:hypothetical protein
VDNLDGTYDITCGDDTVTVTDESCTVVTSGGCTATVSCDDGTFVTVQISGARCAYTQVSAPRGAPGLAACGLTEVGTVECWELTDGTPLYTATGGPFTQVSVGTNVACGLTSAGVVDCWFASDGTPLYTASVIAGRSYTQVSVGTNEACGLDSEGSVVCWRDVSGWYFTTFSSSSGIVQISVGQSRVCTVGGLGWATCHSLSGFSPFTIFGGTGGPFTQVSVGYQHACALANGVVDCWRTSDGGGLYTATGGPFTQISAGSDRACGVVAAGAVECWDVGSETPLFTAAGGPFTQVSSSTALRDFGVTNAGVVTAWSGLDGTTSYIVRPSP